MASNPSPARDRGVRSRRWRSVRVWAVIAGLVWASTGRAQLVITDNLNGAASSYQWQSLGGACLTAGNNTGSIPACWATGRMNGSDPVGQGALRLTDANYNRAGGLVSQFAFPSNQGLQVTFTTVTYGGNRFGGTGADGLSFFLMDADKVPLVNAATRLGSYGGSLGYSHATYGVPGMYGGYIGLGIDEYGNYSNPADNGTGGPGFRPNVVAIRGADVTGFRYIQGSGVVGAIANESTSVRSGATPITFNLSISQSGILNLSYARQGGVASPVISNFPISAFNGYLPRNFHFGFAASTGAGTNIHEITCFKASGITESASSVGANAVQSAKVQVGTQLYLAYYHSDNWWGQLTAQSLLQNPATGAVSINSVANWDANCVLTGGACKSTGVAVTAQPPAARTVLSHNGNQGIAFRWGQLAAAQQAALDPGASVAGSTRLDYLRGDRSNESFQTQNYRPRTGVLGDIVDSSPTWVGPAQAAYAGPWRDALNPAVPMSEGNSYAAFAASTATRTNVVYVGANDGMLHGFRAGAYTAQGSFNASAANDGLELLAYVPQAALLSLHSDTAQLDYSNVQYAHNAYVDATPGVGDLYYQGNWHTWLVGGLGPGGNAGGVVGDNTSVAEGDLYALDITDPARFSEANAAALVVGDWTSASIVCEGDGSATRCGDSLGSTYGTPVVRRMHDGNWAVLMGNGFNSKTGRAGVFVMHVNAQSGARTFRFLDTGNGSATSRNGIAYVTPVDLDGDNVADYLYAGDLAGNVWRFDVTSSNPSAWQVAPKLVFATGGLPITTQVLATPLRQGDGSTRVMLDFGTGRLMPQTLSTAATPDPHMQYLFGVWDWDMTAWNKLGSTPMLALAPGSSAAPPSGVLGPADLQTQTLVTDASYANGNVSGVRTITAKPVCWAGQTNCLASGGNTQFGWKALLPGAQEQVVYSPELVGGVELVSTMIPSNGASLSCSPAPPPSGFTMAFTPDQGFSPAGGYFLPVVSGYLQATQVMGIGLGAVGAPELLAGSASAYLATQTSSGNAVLVQVNPPPNTIQVKRLTWATLR